MWQGETGFSPTIHLPDFVNMHPNLKKRGSVLSMIETTAYVVPTETGYMAYKALPVLKGFPAQAMQVPIGKLAQRERVDRTIKILEASEIAASILIGPPVVFTEEGLSRLALSGVAKIVPVHEGPPPPNAVFYQINHEYIWATPDWMKWQVDLGITGPGRVLRCIKGWNRVLHLDDWYRGRISVICDQIEQPMVVLRDWMCIGAPLLRDDMISEDVDRWDHRRSSKPFLEQKSVLILHRGEYMWSPHSSWSTDQAREYALYTAKMAKVKI